MPMLYKSDVMGPSPTAFLQLLYEHHVCSCGDCNAAGRPKASSSLLVQSTDLLWQYEILHGRCQSSWCCCRASCEIHADGRLWTIGSEGVIIPSDPSFTNVVCSLLTVSHVLKCARDNGVGGDWWQPTEIGNKWLSVSFLVVDRRNKRETYVMSKYTRTTLRRSTIGTLLFRCHPTWCRRRLVVVSDSTSCHISFMTGAL